MTKFKLTERLSVYVDPKTGKECLAGKDHKDNVFLLGGIGSEIELARAEALGLVKAKSAKKED